MKNGSVVYANNQPLDNRLLDANNRPLDANNRPLDADNRPLYADYRPLYAKNRPLDRLVMQALTDRCLWNCADV